MDKIAIIGAGLMGHGLALVFAQGGHEVQVTDPQVEQLATVQTRIEATLKSMGKPTDCVKLIHAATSLEDAVSKADVVVEAAPEKLELKQDLFQRIEAAASQSCILASNTSVIPISKVMAGVKLNPKSSPATQKIPSRNFSSCRYCFTSFWSRS